MKVQGREREHRCVALLFRRDDLFSESRQEDLRVLAARVQTHGLLDPRRQLGQRFELVAPRFIVAEEGAEALGQRLLLLLGGDDGDLQRVDQREHVARQQVLDLRHESREADALIDIALGFAQGRRDVLDRPAR